MTASTLNPSSIESWREQVTVFSEHTVLVVVHGSAQVMVDEEAIDLGCHEALWIPPGFTTDLVRTSPGGVILPVFIPSHIYCEGPVDIVRELLEPNQVDTLIAVYSRQQAGDWQASIAQQFFTGELAHLGGAGKWSGLPPMPRAIPQRSMARSILYSCGFEVLDGEPVPPDNYAVRSHDRQFRIQTGSGLNYWEDKVRCFAALRKLSRGWNFEDACTAAGFYDMNAMYRVFRREMGLTPRLAKLAENEQRRHLNASNVKCSSISNFISSLPPIPESKTYSTVNDYHILVWMYRGNSRVLLNGMAIDVKQDEMIWIPGGIWHRIGLEKDAILIPVRRRGWENPMRRQNMIPFSRSSISEKTLFISSMLEYTELNQANIGEIDIDNYLPEPPNSSLPDDPIIAHLRKQPEHKPETQEEMAKRFGWSVADFMVRFERSIGQHYSDWRSDRRRTLARRVVRYRFEEMRDLAILLGYSCAPAYTRSFRIGHRGEAPSTYRERHDHRWMASANKW